MEYLVRCGYRIVDHNWKTARCEIDVVAFKDQLIHFVEVKYRQSARQGTGLDYITPKKLQQMAFAAAVWRHDHQWFGASNLAAIEVFSPDFIVGEFVESIS